MFEIELVNNDEKVSVSGNSINISDAYYHSFSFIVKLDGKRTNFYRCISHSDLDWFQIKKEIQELNEEIYAIFDVYVNDNYSEYDRSATLQLQNDIDGTSELIEINQQQCNFKIIVNNSEDDTNILNLNKNNMFTNIKIQVYGASKKILLQQNFIELVKNDESFDYDKSLYFYLVPDKENSTEEYNDYTLKIKCLGNFNSLENYIYQIPIIHYSNRNFIFNLKLKPVIESEPTEEEMKKIIDKEYDNNFPSDTILTRNESNKTSEMNEYDLSSISNIALFNVFRDIPFVEPITDITIEGNMITLQTNVYEDDVIVNNSMIILQSKAIWCRAYSEYRDNKHYITVECDDNFWRVERKTFLVVKNAEDITGRVTFLITQTVDNQIKIEKYKS